MYFRNSFFSVKGTSGLKGAQIYLKKSKTFCFLCSLATQQQQQRRQRLIQFGSKIQKLAGKRNFGGESLPRRIFRLRINQIQNILRMLAEIENGKKVNLAQSLMHAHTRTRSHAHALPHSQSHTHSLT